MDQQFTARMHALLQEVYEAGLRDGGAAMREAILKAAEIPVLRAPYRPASPAATGLESAPVRAPRGLLPQVIAQAMAGNEGMTEQQIADAVSAIDPRVSPRSIGGQLRRFRNKVYRQEGRRWFLLEGETAGKAFAAPADLI